MKKIIILTFVVLASFTSSAQITWNIKAGAGVNSPGGCFAAKIGFGPEFHIDNRWSIMPTLEYACKKAEETYGYYNGYESHNHIGIRYIQLPILATYRFLLSGSMDVRIKAGPYYAYALGRDYCYGHKQDIGINAGAEFSFRRFFFGVEAEYGFVKPYTDRILGLYGILGIRF